MTARVRILRRAQKDLLEIQAYVSREDPAAASRMVEGLLEAIASLGEHPRKGPVPNDAHLRAAGFRFPVVGNYLVFYKAPRSLVRVYRVLHGRRAYKRLL